MLVIDDDKILSTLLQVYQFESPRVSGSHGGRPGFNPWSREDILSKHPDINHEGSLDTLIDLLWRKKELMIIPAYGDYPERYLTRTAEMVRTIGTIHEYVARESEDDLESESKRHLQIIEATKWVPASMDRPAREISIEQFREGLSDQMDVHEVNNYRGIQNSKILDLVCLVLQAISIAESIEPDKFQLTKFQDRAIRTALMTSWAGTADSPIIICAGTGSGKTIGFTVPVLVDAIIDTIHKQNRDVDFQGRWTQLMVYPRNDLAFDQYQTLRGYCAKLNELIKANSDMDCNITIALDAGGYIKTGNEKIPGKRIGEWDGQKVKTEWDYKGKQNTNVVSASSRRYGGIGDNGAPTRPANIMIVSSESFRRRLAIPAVVKAVQNIQRVVLDEIHLAEGLNGGHLRGMFNRLVSIKNGKRPLFIAASATIAEERNHVKAIWGSRGEVQVITPTSNEKHGRAGGIANHVLVRPRAGVTKGGPVYNTTSLVGHQSKRKDWSQQRDDASNEIEQWDKILCFADSREFVGRWQMLMNENEGSMHKMRIKERQLRGSGGAISLPYAHWFDRPLAQQLGHDEVCKACKIGCKLPEPIPVEVGKIREFKTKWGGQSSKEYFTMENWDADDDDIVEINSLDECPHLQAGTCWYFAPGIGEKPITGDDDAMTVIRDNLVDRPGLGRDKVFGNTLRFRRHTAGSKDNKAKDGLSTDAAQFSAAEHYRHFSGEAYPSSKPGSFEGHTKIIHDGIIATPTLEVGVDMKNLGTVLTHRAMRNRASYRQKAGRAGREDKSVSNIVTILSRRPGDYQFYRDEQSLIIDELREVVPVAHRNKMIMRSQAYMSVLDWLALNDFAIEQIGSANWTTNIRDAVTKLRTAKQDIYQWIWQGFGTSGLEPVDVYKAIETMRDHLNLIANGNYLPKNEEGMLNIADQIAQANMAKRKYGSNSFAITFKTPENNSNDVNVQVLPKFRNAWGEVKSLLADELNTIIHNFIEPQVSSWFTDPNSEEKDELLELGKSIASSLEAAKENCSQRRDSRIIGDMLTALTKLLDEIKFFEPEASSSENSNAQQLAQELKGTKNVNGMNTNSPGWWYLSWLLGECQTFLNDAPYCYVEKSFINPHEAQIEVKIGDAKHMVKQSMSQFMRDLLPGTWSFRLSSQGGGHACKSPVGGNGLENFYHDEELKKIIVHLSSTSELGELGYPLSVKSVDGQHISYQEIPELIRMGHDKEAIKIVRPKGRIFLAHEKGLSTNTEDGEFDNIPSKINYSASGSKLVYGMDTKDRDPDAGMIPESWPCRWAVTRTEEIEELLAYSPSHPSVTQRGQAGKHNVTSHPMNNLLFENIEQCEKVHVKDVVIGVHRGPRGLALRYQDENETDVVFGRIFETKGIVHKLSQRLLTEMEKNKSNYRELPFDRDALKVIQHHLEKVKVCRDTQRFSNRDLSQLLLLQFIEIKEGLPSTVGDAIDTWRSNRHITPEIKQKYLEGIQPHVRELVQEGIEKVLDEYHDIGPETWDGFQESFLEWQKYALLNTLGKIYVEAASTFTGVQEEKIAFSIDINDMKFTLYDDDAEGNGCCESIWRHYQISEASKSAAGQMRAPPPPSHDFVSIVEKRMRTCTEHIIHRMAFDIYNGLETPNSLRRSKEAANSIADSHSEIWNKLGISNIREAELYSHLSAVLKNEHYPKKSVDEFDQALHVCATGCFICEGAPMASALPLSIAQRYTSRKLVDDLVGLNPDAPGYADARDRSSSLGSSTQRPPEVYPHWRHRNPSDDYQHRFTIPFTVLPLKVGSWVKRDCTNQLPKPVRMLRLLDHLEVND